MAEKMVDFSKENAMRCQCPGCPVQAASACVKDKSAAVMAMMADPPEDEMPSAQDLPQLYCSSGTATCDDLDFSQSCLCPSACEVYKEYGLGQWKYCQRGSAGQIG